MQGRDRILLGGTFSRTSLMSCRIPRFLSDLGLPVTNEETKPDRRLAAIMATDVVGYSKLMQSDEGVALAALAAIREATQSQIKQHWVE
jgi:class 3 adenylate cyclase